MRKELVTHLDPKSPVSEVFRGLSPASEAEN